MLRYFKVVRTQLYSDTQAIKKDKQHISYRALQSLSLCETNKFYLRNGLVFFMTAVYKETGHVYVKFKSSDIVNQGKTLKRDEDRGSTVVKCAINRKVAGSIPEGVIGIFH